MVLVPSQNRRFLQVRVWRGGPKLGRLENLLNHFDTIHLSNKKRRKKVFKLGCAEAGAGGGVEHLVGIFILSAQHRRSLQLEAEKKNFKDVFYLDFKNVLLREKSRMRPFVTDILLLLCSQFFRSQAADRFLNLSLSLTLSLTLSLVPFSDIFQQ